MIPPYGFLLPPLLLLLLILSATADTYPLHQQDGAIRRSSYSPPSDSLPELVWRRCMLEEGDNCQGLGMGGSAGINAHNAMVYKQEQEWIRDHPNNGDGSHGQEVEQDEERTPTKTALPQGIDVETPIPTTELMRATQDQPFVDDELDDDDENFVAPHQSSTQTSAGHGTFLPRHTSSSICSHHSSRTTQGCSSSCDSKAWDIFFNNAHTKDGLGRFVTPELMVVSLVVLFLVAVLVVEVAEGLWRVWHSEPFADSRWKRYMGRPQLQLEGPEKQLVAVPGEKVEVEKYQDFPPGYPSEKEDVNES